MRRDDDDDDNAPDLTTGQLARAGGVNVQTVRFYERHRLIPKPPRTTSGYRKFPRAAVRRVRFIKRAQGLGFTLREIADLLALRIEPGTTCADVERRVARKVAEVDAKLRSLRAVRRALLRLVSSCPGGTADDCAVLAAMDEQGGEP